MSFEGEDSPERKYGAFTITHMLLSLLSPEFIRCSCETGFPAQLLEWTIFLLIGKILNGDL